VKKTKIFVAGATGAIGLPLVHALVQAGHSISGMTLSHEGAQKLRQEGCTAVIASALDSAAVESALCSAKPEVVIDELTSLPKDPADFAAAQPKDTKTRLEGTANLLKAAEIFGVRRFIQQSSGFFLRTADGLADENAPIFNGCESRGRSQRTDVL
jgi:nucleoside-diphosphate-sugar epimerase